MVGGQTSLGLNGLLTGRPDEFGFRRCSSGSWFGGSAFRTDHCSGFCSS